MIVCRLPMIAERHHVVVSHTHPPTVKSKILSWKINIQFTKAMIARWRLDSYSTLLINVADIKSGSNSFVVVPDATHRCSHVLVRHGDVLGG